MGNTTLEKQREYEANKTRNKQMTVRATKEEQELIKDTAKEFNKTLTDLILLGIEALKQNNNN